MPVVILDARLKFYSSHISEIHRVLSQFNSPWPESHPPTIRICWPSLQAEILPEGGPYDIVEGRQLRPEALRYWPKWQAWLEQLERQWIARRHEYAQELRAQLTSRSKRP